jgi:hypothetical protein
MYKSNKSFFTQIFISILSCRYTYKVFKNLIGISACDLLQKAMLRCKKLLLSFEIQYTDVKPPCIAVEGQYMATTCQ